MEIFQNSTFLYSSVFTKLKNNISTVGDTFRDINITNDKMSIESYNKNIKIVDKNFLALIGEKSLINAKNKKNCQIKDKFNSPFKANKNFKSPKKIISNSPKFISAPNSVLKKSSLTNITNSNNNCKYKNKKFNCSTDLSINDSKKNNIKNKITKNENQNFKNIINKKYEQNKQELNIKNQNNSNISSENKYYFNNSTNSLSNKKHYRSNKTLENLYRYRNNLTDNNCYQKYGKNTFLTNTYDKILFTPKKNFANLKSTNKTKIKFTKISNNYKYFKDQTLSTTAANNNFSNSKQKKYNTNYTQCYYGNNFTNLKNNDSPENFFLTHMNVLSITNHNKKLNNDIKIFNFLHDLKELEKNYSHNYNNLKKEIKEGNFSINYRMLKWDLKLQKLNKRNNYEIEKVEKLNYLDNLREIISTQKKYKNNFILNFGNKRKKNFTETQNQIYEDKYIEKRLQDKDKINHGKISQKHKDFKKICENRKTEYGKVNKYINSLISVDGVHLKKKILNNLKSVHYKNKFLYNEKRGLKNDDNVGNNNYNEELISEKNNENIKTICC